MAGTRLPKARHTISMILPRSLKGTMKDIASELMRTAATLRESSSSLSLSHNLEMKAESKEAPHPALRRAGETRIRLDIQWRLLKQNFESA
mmetsp:Transcript_30759/g.69351  ORF Transcript_30759/g.69351 Transcript_30759/m.69351 type:complete len:91 (-) Transcript_30759:148-420(-)